MAAATLIMVVVAFWLGQMTRPEDPCCEHCELLDEEEAV